MWPCDQSLETPAFPWETLSQPQFYKHLTRKNQLFWMVILVQVQWFGTGTRYWLTITCVEVSRKNWLGTSLPPIPSPLPPRSLKGSKLVPELNTKKLLKLLLVDMKVNSRIFTWLKMAGMAQNKQQCLIFIVFPRVRVENQISWISQLLKEQLIYMK